MHSMKIAASALLLVTLAACQSTPTDRAESTAAQADMARHHKHPAAHKHDHKDKKKYEKNAVKRAVKGLREDFIAEHDSDADGSVSSSEFAAFRTARFELGDVNRDGYLDSDEYANEYAVRLERQIFNERKSHLEQTQTRFNSLDKNDDGSVSWEEYKASGDRAFVRFDPDNSGHVAARDSDSPSAPRMRPRTVLNMPTTHSIQGFLDLYDEDADGVVTREEFDQHRRAAFDETDSNGDGRLSADEYRAEFENRLDRRIDQARDAQIKQAYVRFKAVDIDKNGRISPQEYQEIGMRTFKRWDTNDDGVVSASDPLPKLEAMQRTQSGAKTQSSAKKSTENAQSKAGQP